MINSVDLTQSLLDSMQTTVKTVSQGKGEHSSGNNPLVTVGLTSCIGIGLFARDDESQKFYLMHLDDFSFCISELQKAYQHFKTPPKIVFFATRNGAFTDPNKLSAYQASDDRYEALDHDTIDRTINTEEEVRDYAALIKCSIAEVLTIKESISISFPLYLSNVIEQNAKIRAIMHYLKRTDVEIIDVPSGSLIITHSMLYLDKKDLLSTHFTESTGFTSESSCDEQESEEKSRDHKLVPKRTASHSPSTSPLMPILRERYKKITRINPSDSTESIPSPNTKNIC